MAKSERKKQPKETFEQIYARIGEPLKTLFGSLEQSQKSFVSYCKNNGRLLFSEKSRFIESIEQSKASLIDSILTSVLDIEYKDDISMGSRPGSTTTHYAVIALPTMAGELIDEINTLKNDIREMLSQTVDSRVKVDGQWQPVNKLLLKAIGRPRANSNQIRRRLNAHTDQYVRISLSGTWQRPVYKKSYADIEALLEQFNYENIEQDKATLKAHKHHPWFAYFYDNYYTSMEANFKFSKPTEITLRNGNVVVRKQFTQKISSPIYILTDKPIDTFELEIRYKMKQVEGGHDISSTPTMKPSDSKISSEPIIKNPPIYTYLR